MLGGGGEALGLKPPHPVAQVQGIAVSSSPPNDFQPNSHMGVVDGNYRTRRPGPLIRPGMSARFGSLANLPRLPDTG